MYRLDQVEEALDLGLAEMLDEGGVTLIEWGDTIIPALPADYLEIRIRLGEGDEDRVLELIPVGNRWSARVRALLKTARVGSLDRRGARDAGSEGALDADPRDRHRHRLRLRRGQGATRACSPPRRPSAAASTPRRSRPPSSSCAAGRRRLSEISVVAVDLGPGLFTGLRVGVAAAKAMAHTLRVPMIGVPSLDLVAFPCGTAPS